MELSTEQIEKTLAAFRGRQTPIAAQAWSAELAQSPELATEVQTYNTILDGLAAQANLNFQTQIEQLEGAAANDDDAELIEWYYLGELSPARMERVEIRAAHDPAFAQLMTASKSLYDGFASLRSMNFKAQMADWESQNTREVKTETAKVVTLPKRKPILRRLAIAAAVLLVAGFGLRWYASQNFSTNTLVAQAQVEPRTGSLLSARGAQADPVKVLKEDIQSAYKQLEVGNYEAAQTAFTLLQKRVADEVPNGPRKQALIDNLAWNTLLAQIGSDGMTAKHQTQLKAFAENTQFNYRNQATDLLEKTESLWYRIGN